ncbi:MAG: hypothetical protein JSR76_05325 [Verrucomicrobia bacterium]|nr:hypothetical protein [Verrucomicrobiota bacterium]
MSSITTISDGLRPYLIPPIAAGLAIIPVFPELAKKSLEQQGLPLSSLSYRVSLKNGLKGAPTVGIIVATQTALQSSLEKRLSSYYDPNSAFITVISSFLVGAGSAPILAIFNGQTMGWSIRHTMRRFSTRQAAAITLQETAFVAGLSLADKLAVVMKRRFGDRRGVDYTAAFVAGYAGSLAGHPANTALTRWQNGLTVTLKNSLWGSLRKAKAIGVFAVLYKFGKENLSCF